MRTLVLGLLVFLSGSALYSECEPLYEAGLAVKYRDYKELNHLVQNHAKSISLKRIVAFAKQYKNSKVLRAAEATQTIQRSGISIGMPMKELFSLCLFVETKFPHYLAMPKHYLQRDTEGLSRAVEYDPETKKTFIHLGWKGHEEIGRGTNKIVTKAVLYDGKNSEIVARCEQSLYLPDEWKLTKHLKGVKGLADSKAFTTHEIKGTKYYTIYSKLYQPGPLSKILKKGSHHFSLQDKVKIAYDIMKGLVGMKKKNVTHRDFCGQNCLINIQKGKTHKERIEAVVMDFGCAAFANDKIAHTRPQGHSCYTAPEGIFRDGLEPQDYFKTDLFAAGALFYCMQIEFMPKWMDPLLIRVGQKSPEYRYNKHVHLITEAINKRRAAIRKSVDQTQKLSRQERFELLILKMINPNPKKRGSAEEHLKALEKLYSQFEQ